MSRHESSIQLRPARARVIEARAALEQLHLVLDETKEPSALELVHAARTLWISIVFDLADLQEEVGVRWPYVFDEDLDGVARRAANRYEAFVAPLIDFQASTFFAHARIRDAIGRVIDTLDLYVDLDRREASAG